MSGKVDNNELSYISLAWLRSTRRCPRCEGTGHLWDRFTHGAALCPVCDGRKRLPIDHPYEGTRRDVVD